MIRIKTHIPHLKNRSFNMQTNMKTILVDAFHTFVDTHGIMNQDLYKLLESYTERKIILTNAPKEKMKTYGLDHVPYEVFSLEHTPEKTDPMYYHTMVEHFDLLPSNVVYIEHAKKAVASAQSIGIVTHWYDAEKKDITAVKKFLYTYL